MAIEKINWRFVNGETPLDEVHLNEVLTKLNLVIDEVNANEPMETETTAILARYTKSLTTSQKLAFNSFVKTLKTNGIYDKLNVLILPFLASNIGEATKNALSGTSAFSANGDTLALSDNGISAVEGANVALFDKTASADISATDLHVSFFNNNVLPNYATGKADMMFSWNQKGIVSFGKNYANGSAGAGVQYFTSSSSQNHIYNGGATSHTEAQKFCLVSANSNKVIVCYDGNIQQSVQIMSGVGYATDARFAQYSGNTYKAFASGTEWETMSQANYGLISIGKALTDAQATSFNDAVNALMNVILG